MRYQTVLEFANLFFAGILSGLEIAIHYGFQGPTVALEEKPQIVLRQGVVRRLRWLVPAFFLPTALLGVAVTVVDRASPGLFFRIAALTGIAVWIGVRIAGTVRVNSATIEWNPNQPPNDWREQLAKVEKLHIVGTWAALFAFLFFLTAMARRLS